MLFVLPLQRNEPLLQPVMMDYRDGEPEKSNLTPH